MFTISSARLEVVNRIRYGDLAFLFTGDTEAHTERAMLARGHALWAPVLQLGHPGSRTSSSPEFLATLRPEGVVHSAARGNLGHPRLEIRATLILRPWLRATSYAVRSP